MTSRNAIVISNMQFVDRVSHNTSMWLQSDFIMILKLLQIEFVTFAIRMLMSSISYSTVEFYLQSILTNKQTSDKTLIYLKSTIQLIKINSIKSINSYN